MQLLYFAGTGFVRLSIVAFLPRLSKDSKWNSFKIYAQDSDWFHFPGQVIQLSWALGGAVASMSIICFFIMLFECKHVPWVTCWYSKLRWDFNAEFLQTGIFGIRKLQVANVLVHNTKRTCSGLMEELAFLSTSCSSAFPCGLYLHGWCSQLQRRGYFLYSVLGYLLS